ncbi:spore protease YyaC [Paenibacillus odorifer]|nr:spore protease YyaC [Paenibacillus odorifer]
MAKTLSAELRRALGRRRKNIVFACIGTDRSTGDSLGPMVGTYLARMGYEVVGTLDDPLHAVNLEERINQFDKKKTVIAIDACLGYSTSVGRIDVAKGPVNVGGFMEYMVLQNTRLSLVMKLADQIVQAITQVLPAPYMQEVAASNQ